MSVQRFWKNGQNSLCGWHKVTNCLVNGETFGRFSPAKRLVKPVSLNRVGADNLVPEPILRPTPDRP
jgi:hypothetical protein